MGLTIHWQAATKPGEDARAIIAALRQKAFDLPFEEVGPTIDLQGESACDYKTYRRDEADWARLGWFLIQADTKVKLDSRAWRPLTPHAVIGFPIFVGEDCEPMNIALSRFPSHITVQGRGVIETGHDPATWYMKAFCKTQYASRISVEHFLRCHLGVIAMLRAMQDAGLQVEVSDEGGYWETQDVEALVSRVGESNELVAALAGALSDDSSVRTYAPVFDFAEFERLEHEGNAKWHDLAELVRETRRRTSS
jgi:hypothetical protein